MLYRPWCTPIILSSWLIAVHWLITTKVLSTQPVYSTVGNHVFFSSENQFIPVAWTVLWDDQSVGHALSRAHQTSDSGLTVETFLKFDNLPLDKIFHPWLTKNIPFTPNERLTFPLRATGIVKMDSFGSLLSFSTSIVLPATKNHISLEGNVQDNLVAVSIDVDDIHYEIERQLPEDVMLRDELSPQATIPGLFVGKKWIVPTYNPLKPSTSTIDLYYANVVKERMFFWHDHLIRVYEVNYHNNPATTHRDPDFTLLVDMDGRVLKQESMFLGSKLSFLRRTTKGAEALNKQYKTHQNPPKSKTKNGITPSTTADHIQRQSE